MSAENQLIAKPETWDAVAETYNIEIEESDIKLADDIEKMLLRLGLQKGDSLIEMGCGSGHLSACLAQKGYRVILLDFSPIALGKAQETFKKYNLTGEFILGDIFHLDESVPVCDFAWNSGVMEHFGDYEITILVNNIQKYAQKGVLYLVPNSNSIAYLLMRARLMSEDKWIYGEEYLRRDYEIILKNVGYQHIVKSYISTASISAYQMWKAEKEEGNISELYKQLLQEKMLPEEESYLLAYYASNYTLPTTSSSYAGTTLEDTRLFNLVAKSIGYINQKQQIEKQANIIQELETKLEKQLELHVKDKALLLEFEKKYSKQELQFREKISQQESYFKEKISQQKSYYKEKISQQEDFLNQGKKEYENRILSHTKIFENKVHELEKDMEYCKSIIIQKDEYILQAQELCNHFATGKLMRLNHFLFRIKGQILKGSKSERKDFWSWLIGRIRHTNRSLGAGTVYNPLMVINSKLQEALSRHFLVKNYPKSIDQTSTSAQELNMHPTISDALRRELAKDYINYDVIILSVIDYNFRHQRPQHFATRFAANGHRVFYVNANFIRPDSVTVVQENLYVVDFSNDQYNAIYAMDGHTTQPWMQKKFDGLLFEQGIRDAVIVVDYPNWVKGAEFLREKYGFKIITDYMDDYTGFLGTAETFLKDNCIHLLQTSDMIAASSQFLFEVAASHTDRKKIEIIRNGTEVNHFYQAAYLESPDKKRSIIGYYGAVAHWFAWEKVCYLASRLSECDIVIVGDVTEHRAKLEQYSNIKLLGEKPYQELPKYLADFDVCLIPFDTSTDLIKATNPVKFYEYLSAGKKVVATEIPELMPYRNEYVYMSNEEETFVEYVKLCLEGKDCLKGREDCITFARENDWQKRYEAFESACIRYIPKVSIIVLTYNNLELNKQCIDSILRKTAYGNYDLIIVDNKSTDGTVEYLKSLQLQDIHNVKIILNDENLGFAGGNNVGIKAASGDYVLLLNNDTVVSRGWLTAMVKHMENNLEYGMCNPVTNSIGNESMIKVRYHNAQELSEFAYITTANNMNMEYSDVDKMPLFATIIRKEMIDKIGMLDESYKIGMFEDDDYLEAALEANYGVVIAEDSFVHHINNGTFRKMEDEEYKKIFETNKKIFEEKWNKKWHMPKYRFGINWNTNEGMGL